MGSITKKDRRKGNTSLLPLPAQVTPQKVTEPSNFAAFGCPTYLFCSPQKVVFSGSHK